MKRLVRVAILLATWSWLGTGFVAFAEGLPSAKPEQVGLSSERLALITETLRKNIAAGEIPGAVLLIARQGKIAYFESLGLLDPQAETPMGKDAIFRIYSMSKPITTVAAMMLFEDGALTLDDPVGKYLPPLAKMQVAVDNKPDPEADPSKLTFVPSSRPISIQDLMRHTSGLTYGPLGTATPVKKLYTQANLLAFDGTNAEFVERIAKLPLSYQPGTTWDYSHSTDVLGRLVEVVSGKSLYSFEKERILEPLGMQDTSFNVTDQSKLPRIAEPLQTDRTIGGSTMFDPRVAGKWEAGGQGMVSTAIDYARFLQLMLNGGTFEGKRILGPKTIAYMTSDHLGNAVVNSPGPGYGFGLGFAVRRNEGVSPVNGSLGDYHWGGAGGTGFWVDPKEQMIVVLMMQAPSQRIRYRSLLRDMIYAAIVQEFSARR